LVAGLGYAFGNDSRINLRVRLLRKIVIALYRTSFNQYRYVFFQNPDDRRDFVDRGLIPHGRAVHVNGTGVDLCYYSEVVPKKEPVTFLLAARLIPEKGIGEFAEAAAELRAQGFEARFIILGQLDDNPSALPESQLKEWVAHGILEWPGAVSDVRPWLAETSVFVLPSYYREGVPRSIQEAMAMGRPVITTDTPGCRETVDEGVNGYLVTPGDAASLAHAMVRFLVNPEEIVRMGRAGRRLAEERFDVRRINEQMLKAMGVNRG